MAWFGSDPLADLKAAVERLAAGDYAARAPQFDDDAANALGQQINALAVRVQSTLQNVAQDQTYLTTVLSNMTEGVVAVDLQGHVIIMNPALGIIFNVKPENARGRLFLEAVRHNQLNDLVQYVLKEAKPKSGEVYVLSSQDLIFEAHAIPLMNGAQATGALIVLRDVTQLRHLEKVRRDFVANVSHELRTPLASIKGFAETLRDGALDDPKHALEFVTSIEKHADNMIALVKDLLDLTSIESGQRAPQRQSIQLPPLIDEVIKNLKPIAQRKKVDMKNDVAPSAPTVMADKQHLTQILVNLAENAVKFNEPGGWLRFSADQQGSQLMISVTDNGPGIPAQDLPRIFERFYRSDRARSRDQGGTGLGLSIVKHLVEANHGSVSVESSVGKGSRFFIVLPCHATVT